MISLHYVLVVVQLRYDEGKIVWQLLLFSLQFYIPLIILLGFRYLASSIPIISFAGVAIGVGLVFSLVISNND